MIWFERKVVEVGDAKCPTTITGIPPLKSCGGVPLFSTGIVLPPPATSKVVPVALLVTVPFTTVPSRRNSEVPTAVLVAMA